MQLKEIFEAEPIQKNALIIFIGMIFISFLQIYLFEPQLMDKNILLPMGYPYLLLSAG